MSHGEFFAPVLRLPVSDVDRRVLRQILNKLKGKHSKELDGAEYMRIIEGWRERLPKSPVGVCWGEAPGTDLGGEPEGSNIIPSSYELIIECKDETEQTVLL